jgi:hypothetical protein
MPQTIPVDAFCIQMQLGRNLRLFQRQKVNGGILDVDGIVLSLHDEGRRVFLGDFNFRIRGEVLFRECQISWIDDNLKTRSAAYLIRGIDSIVKAFVK